MKSEMKERFVKDHRRIGTLAADLRSLLRGPAPTDPDALVSARWAFASALMQHLASKERHIYAKLEHDPRMEIVTYSAKSKSDLIRRFAAYTTHMQDWPTARALADWPTYRTRAIAMVDAFVERLKWEETELVGFVERHGIDIDVPAAVTSNWVRQAFEVKASVEDRSG